jgi:hypothetical protein
MNKYKVPILRISYGFKDIFVFANDEKEAIEKAIDEAGNYEFSERSSEYELDMDPVLIEDEFQISIKELDSLLSKKIIQSKLDRVSDGSMCIYYHYSFLYKKGEFFYKAEEIFSSHLESEMWDEYVYGETEDDRLISFRKCYPVEKTVTYFEYE